MYKELNEQIVRTSIDKESENLEAFNILGLMAYRRGDEVLGYAYSQCAEQSKAKLKALIKILG